MKKIIVIILCVLMLFTFSACSRDTTSFLSQRKVDKLVDKYGTPQVKMTLNFKSKTGETDIALEVTYDLLLDKAPMTVISFINLINSGRYNNVCIDEKNTTYTYFGIGNLSYAEKDISVFSLVNATQKFAGEFKTNNFEAYGDGEYTQGGFFNLTMWHDDFKTVEEDAQQEEYRRAFNSANGRVLLTYGNASLNYKNYAVFAKPVSYAVSFNGGEFTQPSKEIPPRVFAELTGLGYTVQPVAGESYRPLKVGVSFEMVPVNGIDWSKIPENYFIDAE